MCDAGFPDDAALCMSKFKWGQVRERACNPAHVFTLQPTPDLGFPGLERGAAHYVCCAWSAAALCFNIMLFHVRCLQGRR